MYDARDNEAQLEALQEIFDILGFTPTWRDNATMESLLRANERIEEALPFAKKCVDEIPREDPQRNTLLHDYAVCLLQDGRVIEELNATLEINHADATHRTV